MRETLNDWKNEWIETNGQTDETEVLIKDSSLNELSGYIYEGSFAGILENILDRKVIEASRIADSSVSERIGAYSLLI